MLPAFSFPAFSSTIGDFVGEETIFFIRVGSNSIQMFFGITGAFVKEGTREQRVIIARYSGHRWCDSTERALSSELMGRHSWFNCK